MKRFNSTRRCPICNHVDWCGWETASSGRTYIHCMRGENVGCTTRHQLITGFDGEVYHCYGVNEKGCTTFELESEVQSFKKVREDNYWEARKASPVAKVRKKERDDTFMEPLENSKVSAVYRALCDKLVLEEKHHRYLLSEGWTDEMLKKHHIVSLPEEDGWRYRNKEKYNSRNPWRKELLRSLREDFSLRDLLGVPGLYLQLEPERILKINSLGGILFPQYDVKGHTYRMKIRVDRRFFDGRYNDISEQEYQKLLAEGQPCRDIGKYLQVSSMKEVELEDSYTNKYPYGTGSGSNLSYYMSHNDDYYCCWITEGEKKGIFANTKLHAPVISIPGVSSWSKMLEKDQYGLDSIEHMRAKGTEIFIVALDADKAYNKNVLKSQSNIVEAFKARGVRIAVANWSGAVGKGLDDLLATGGVPSFELI